MAINFPDSPATNNTYTVGSNTWLYDGEKWVIVSQNIELDDLGDVTAPSPSNGDLIQWNGTAWVNVASSTVGATNLDGLSDVVVTSPLEYESLVYNGTNWVNQYASTATYVRNAEATTLTTGTVVYLFGATGDHATVKRADNDSDTTSSKTVGLVASPIAASENGPVVTRGYVDGIDLSTGYASGDVLWLGEDGAFTKTKPSAPEHLVFIGVVVRATNNGIVYVATQNGYELDELHDVSIVDKTSGDFLKYNGTLWVNDQINLGTDTVGNYMSNVSAGTGISVSHTPGEGSTATVSINATLDNLSDVTAPSPTNGQFLKWDGSAWVNATISSGGGVTVSETPPASPTAGDLWFESDTGKTFVYYDSFWVESSGADGSQGSTGNTGPEGGSTTLTTKGDILARNSSEIVRLPVGTNGKVLTANSSTAIGLEWVTPTVYATVANVGTLSSTVDLKANIDSPVFTGTPVAPNPGSSTNNTQIATTYYVKAVINDLINSAPSTLDTLGEIASSLANNASLSSTLTTSIALKAPLADPTFTGTVSGITKSMVGLGSVDNTTDLGKPISNATQTALDLKAPLANATFTGTIVLPATTSIANVTSTEIGYLDGVTSAIQTQIDSKLSTSSAATLYEKLIPYSNTAPVSPTEGDLWVDSTVPTIKAYIGSSWVALGGVADDDQPILAARIFS